MAIEQLFEALPLHYLQHGISKFGAANIALAVVVTAALGVFADYAWMLYLRSKMVSMTQRLAAVNTDI
jgi:hypothetical protein